MLYGIRTLIQCRTTQTVVAEHLQVRRSIMERTSLLEQPNPPEADIPSLVGAQARLQHQQPMQQVVHTLQIRELLSMRFGKRIGDLAGTNADS